MYDIKTDRKDIERNKDINIWREKERETEWEGEREIKVEKRDIILKKCKSSREIFYHVKM